MHTDSSEEKQKIHEVKKIHSSSSSITSEEEDKVQMKEEDIPELPKLDFKISELSPGHLLLPS